MIGAKAEAIEKGEDRLKFKEAMQKIGLDLPVSGVAHTLDEAREVTRKIGRFPVIIRPAFTLGGTGGGIAYNREEFDAMAQRGLEASPVTEIFVEESLIGWKEFETEVMRDKADNCVIVCSIENLDPMGVHTGDSITVAPIQTLTDKEWQIMRDASFACIREIGVETGGSNIQFAVDPEDRPDGHHRDEPARQPRSSRWPRRPPGSPSPRSPPNSPSVTRSTKSPTTSPKPLPPASSRRLITSSSRCRGSPLKNSRKPTQR